MVHEEEEKKYYKPVRVGNFWSNNYTECKSIDDRIKTLSVEEYLNKIRPYLKDTINNLKKSDSWKMELTIATNFISSKDDNDEECVMPAKGDNIEIMINDKADAVIKELFESPKKDNDDELVFNYIYLLYYKCHKISTNRGRLSVNSPDWIKKATINPINKKDNKCFQYAVTVALNHEEIKKDLLRITKIKPFINKYDWEGTKV